MEMKKLLEIIPFYQATKPISDIIVKGLSMDSRSTSPGDLFVCIRGVELDGHHYVSEAIGMGAVAIVAEEKIECEVPVIIVNDTTRALAMISSVFYKYPTEDLQLIGVTGTNGKTTVTYLVEEVFRLHKQRTGVIGTIQISIDGTTYPVKNTTPDSLTLQGHFSKMNQAGVKTAIMEVSSHALDQGRVFGCDFDTVIFTNLSQDHLDYHENFEDYLRAKSLLFAQLGNGYNMKRKKFVVINSDSPVAQKLIRSTAQPLVTYGIQERADVKAENIRLQETGTSFTLVTPKGSVEVKSPLMGLFSIYNMLASAGAALVSGVPLDTIKSSFAKTSGVRGRFEPVLEGQSFGVVIDYAHTPDSLQNVLKTMKEFCRGRVRVVLGCGGDRDRTKRPVMADVAMKFADHIVFTSDNPRTEDPDQILEDMTRHLTGYYDVIKDRRAAIQYAIKQSQQGDMILIAGKGHETYQEINGRRYDFDDREVAREILKKLRGVNNEA